MARCNKKYCPACGIRVERYYSPQTFAKLLDISVELVRKMIRRGQIRYKRIGRLIRIPSSELERVGVNY